jgi:hypothetical protein
MTAVATSLWLSPFRAFAVTPSLTASALTASAHKFAWVGQMWNKARATKSIRKVWFLPTAITSAGGSTCRISLQDVDASTGLPARPDGVQDQTVDFLVSAPTAGTMYQTAALSADRSVAFGEWVAVVLEFQTYLGADAISVQNLGLATSNHVNMAQALLNTASWAIVTAIPNVILEFSDGTYGTLDGAFVLESITSNTVTTATTPDEFAIAFQVPFAGKVDGCYLLGSSAGAGRDVSIRLYQGVSNLQSVAIDGDRFPNTSGRAIIVPIPETDIAADTQYYVSWRPDTASNTTVYSFAVNTAAHLDCHPGGQTLDYATRTDAGAWTISTTKRLFGGVRFSAIDSTPAAGAVGVIGG